MKTNVFAVSDDRIHTDPLANEQPAAPSMPQNQIQAQPQPAPPRQEDDAAGNQRGIRRYFEMVVTQQNINFIEENRVLFVSGKTEVINPDKQTYLLMLQNNICPHIEWYSLAPILIAICTIVYIVEVSIGFTSNTFLEVSQTTYTQMGVNTANLVYHGQVYRLVVCLFLHVNLIHLVANMLALLLILATMQYSFGWWKTLGLYLACGIVSNIFSDLITPDQFNNMIKLGASNPLYGLIAVSAGYMVINWNSMASIGPIFKFRILITLILVLVFMFMFTDQAGSPDYVGHLGGLLTGFLISGLLPSLKLQQREIVLRILFSVLFVALVLSCFLIFYLAPQSSYSF